MRRTLIEALHLIAGLIVTVVVAWGAAWGAPGAGRSIWLVASVVMGVVALTGMRPLLVAWRSDRGGRPPAP